MSVSDVDPSLDWTLRHGRSVALYVALKEAPERIMSAVSEASVCQTILQNVQSDRVCRKGCFFFQNWLFFI